MVQGVPVGVGEEKWVENIPENEETKEQNGVLNVVPCGS